MESTVEEILKTVERFRILCVGRSGVGKSSAINRVFGLQKASVAHWETGEADIEKPLTSDDNRFLVLHDSKGFEPGDTQTFDIVSRFIKQRREKSLPLKDRLHAVWLCTETPRAGGRVFETGDENLLQLAHEAQIPIVVVFTKYDRLVWSKRKELEEDYTNLGPEELDRRGTEEAQKVLDTCVQSVENAFRRLGLKEQTIRHANVSINPGYEAGISSLVEVTRVVVQEKLKGDAWVAWAVTQRANLPLKIDTCIDTGTVHYRRFLDGVRHWQVSLHDFLAEIHQDIITCWNFRDGGEILGNDVFKQLMLYLVEDVQESQNYGKSRDTPPAINKIFQSLESLSNAASPSTVAPLPMTRDLTDWLRATFLNNSPQIRRLLMTYTIDLTTVLKSLFEVKLSRMPQTSSAGITWSEVKEAFEAYEHSARRQIHRRISQIFQQDQQISDTDSFRRIFRELVEAAEMHASKSAPEATSNKGRVPTPNPPPVAIPNPPPGRTSSPSPGATSESASGQPRRRRVRLPCLCV